METISPFWGQSSSFTNGISTCCMRHRHISLPKISSGYLGRIKRYPNSTYTFQLSKLVLSGVISPNPGPEKCAKCSRTIACNHRTIICVSCDVLLHHIKFAGVTSREYQILRKSVTKNVWNCVSCVSRKLLAELPFAESF